MLRKVNLQEGLNVSKHNVVLTAEGHKEGLQDVLIAEGHKGVLIGEGHKGVLTAEEHKEGL